MVMELTIKTVSGARAWSLTAMQSSLFRKFSACGAMCRDVYVEIAPRFVAISAHWSGHSPWLADILTSIAPKHSCYPTAAWPLLLQCFSRLIIFLSVIVKASSALVYSSTSLRMQTFLLREVEGRSASHQREMRMIGLNSSVGGNQFWIPPLSFLKRKSIEI